MPEEKPTPATYCFWFAPDPSSIGHFTSGQKPDEEIVKELAEMISNSYRFRMILLDALLIHHNTLVKTFEDHIESRLAKAMAAEKDQQEAQKWTKP